MPRIANMWCINIQIVSILLLIINLGESAAPATPSTDKSVGDDKSISMATHRQFIANGSSLDVTCKMKYENGKPANLQFWNDDDYVELKNTSRLKITITEDKKGNRTVGRLVWNPIYVKDNFVKSIRCRNKDSSRGKTFDLTIIPSASIPKVQIVNGSKIELEKKVSPHKLVCYVTCKTSDVLKDFEAQWMIGDLNSKTQLPTGILQEYRKINATTGSATLTISDSKIIDKSKLYCVSKMKFKDTFDIVRAFSAETNITVVGGPVVKHMSKEIKAKEGQDAVLDCMAIGSSIPTVTWWKKDEYNGSTVAMPALTDMRYSHKKSSVKGGDLSAPNSVIFIRDVTYKDRSQFVCQAEFADSIVNTTFTLRVADPFGALWPVVGIIVEALVMVIIIWYTEFNQKREQRKKNKANATKDEKPSKDSEDHAPLVKSNADGSNEVTA